VRVVVQRVTRASVAVEGRVVGAIERGFVVLAGFTHGDAPDGVGWMAEKIAGLRLFADDDGKMNRALGDVGGAALVVSQFTLYGDARKGRRPAFVDAAPPEVAEPLYDGLVAALRERGIPVATGVFGATMTVELVNDGPVTLLLER
jgi:D-tyrosyl-tRNA(Tyr) deacylase